MRRIALLAVLILVLGAAAPAAAAGTHLSPVRDRYEVGDVATLVGYTSGGQLGWVQDGPFSAYLLATDATVWATHHVPPESVALGPLTIEARGRTLRVSISFRVPDSMAPGVYTVSYCNDPCTTGLGDVIGGSLAIGVDPPRPVEREWFLDDPEIANLSDDAVLTGPGYRASARDVRAGRVTAPAGWGSDSVSPAPNERPNPQSAQPVPPVESVTTAALPPPVTAPVSQAHPVEPRNHWWRWPALLVAIASALGIVIGLRRVTAAEPPTSRPEPDESMSSGDPQAIPEPRQSPVARAP